MQINPLSTLLKGYKVEDRHRASVPQVRRTPEPERNKVVVRPDRQPINKQSALLIRPLRCWLSQPQSEAKLPTKEQKEIDALKAELKTERNAHAASRDEVGNLRLDLKASKKKLASLSTRIQELESAVAERDKTIRQLEDIRL